MINRDDKRMDRDKKAKEEYEQWHDFSQAHWSHWRAWGSWFSWGSPVGLGLFCISIAITFAIVKWAFAL